MPKSAGLDIPQAPPRIDVQQAPGRHWQTPPGQPEAEDDRIVVWHHIHYWEAVGGIANIAAYFFFSLCMVLSKLQGKVVAHSRELVWWSFLMVECVTILVINWTYTDLTQLIVSRSFQKIFIRVFSWISGEHYLMMYYYAVHCSFFLPSCFD